MCTPSKQFASKCFSPFYFKQKFKGNCLQNSLRGRRLKGKGKGILGARGAPLAFLSHLKLPFPSLSNACHGGYGDVEWTKVRFEIRTSYISDPAGKNTNEDSKWRLQDRRMLFNFPNGVTQCSLRRVTRKFWSPFIPGERSTAKDTLHWFVWILCSVGRFLACENIRFSSPFTAGEVSRETSQRQRARWKNGCFRRLLSYSPPGRVELERPPWLVFHPPGTRPFSSYTGSLYQNEVECSAFDTGMSFHSLANKNHFHKKGCAF